MTPKLVEINRLMDSGIPLSQEQTEDLRQIANTFARLDREAATYVEGLICVYSRRFTGDPPYTGWKGLGLALKEDYDELADTRKVLKLAQEFLEKLAALPLSREENFNDRRLAVQMLSFEENDGLVQTARNLSGRALLAQGRGGKV